MTEKMRVVSDPTSVATLSIEDPDWHVYMGDDLVYFVQETGEDVLYKIGTQTVLFDEGEWVELARRSIDSVPLAIAAIADTVVVEVDVDNGLPDPDGGPKTQYWVVSADGTQNVTDGDTADEPQRLDGNRIEFDQRVAPSLRMDYFADDDERLKPIPTGDPGAVLDAGDPTEDWNRATTWAAFILGDNTEEQTQPDPPDPFDTTLTSTGHHTTDHQVVFNWEYDRPDVFGRWDLAQLTWTWLGGGAEPIIDFGILGVGALVSDIPADAPTDLGLVGSALSSTQGGYITGFDPGGGSVTGVPALLLNPANDPTDFPDAATLDNIQVSVSATFTTTPDAPHAFRRGEYRYLNTAHDDTSDYADLSGTGAPGTEYMKSDFIDAAAGRWTAVVGLLQTSDQAGGGTQFAMCVHFEPFGGFVLPPLRMYPREDALGAGSSRRLYPPPRSIQASNRRAGGYT